MLTLTIPVFVAFSFLQGLQAMQARPSANDEAANAHYRSGWEHFASEAWPEAAREFQAAVDLNPQFKLAYYGLGRANMAQKRFVDAIRAYEKCRDVYVAQASANFSNKTEADRLTRDDLMQIDTAIARLSSGPQSNQTQAQIAQMRSSRMQLENKTRGLDTMSISSQVPPFVSLALGSAYFRSGRMTDAEKEYKAAVEADSKMGEAHNNLAALYLQSGRLDEAEKEVKAAEKAGFKVHPQLKADIQSAKKKTNE